MDHAAYSKVLLSFLRLELGIDWILSARQQWNWQRVLEQNENHSITPGTDAWEKTLHMTKKGRGDWRSWQRIKQRGGKKNEASNFKFGVRVTSVTSEMNKLWKDLTLTLLSL